VENRFTAVLSGGLGFVLTKTAVSTTEGGRNLKRNKRKIRKEENYCERRKE